MFDSLTVEDLRLVMLALDVDVAEGGWNRLPTLILSAAREIVAEELKRRLAYEPPAGQLTL